MKELIGFRTITRGDETVRIPIYKKTGSKDYIQKSIKHPGRVREIIQRWYGKDGFDDKGRIKPEYLIKAKQKAKEEHNRSLEDAIDLAIRLKKMDKTKPYGETRSEAEEQVDKLRDEGMHARLEETNRNKGLYAPYEGVLPVDKGEDEQKPAMNNTPPKTEQNEENYEDKYVEISVNRSKGYAGKTRLQGWISKPLRPGEHSREFIQPDHMDWGDSELYRKNKGQWDAVYHLQPDEMYDMNYGGGASTQSIVTWRDKKSGNLKYTVLSDERREKMLKLIDNGESVREARIQTIQKQNVK